MKYELIRSARRTMAIEVKNGKVTVRAPLFVTDAAVRGFVLKNLGRIEAMLEKQKAREAEMPPVERLTQAEIDALARRAARVIPERVLHYASAAGVTYGRITIRCQKTKWGSCSSKGNLNFNCLLMLAPAEVLDSVVAHEVCHRREMNHSDRFYALLKKICPDYDRWNQWLKKNGNALMRRAWPQ